jgi:DNA-binding NarL/FixJ family response regulator
MTEPIRLLIADDQARTRQSLRAWLSSRLPLGEVLEAESGREALRHVERQAPDIVVMDARMADGDGIEATRAIKQGYPQVKVLVLSLYPSYQAAAIAAGADAFLTKDEEPERLLSTLTSLLS